MPKGADKDLWGGYRPSSLGVAPRSQQQIGLESTGEKDTSIKNTVVELN